MNQVTFNDDEILYRFVIELTKNYAKSDEYNIITFGSGDQILKEQFERLANGQPCIVPYEPPESAFWFWLLLGSDTHTLEQMRIHLESFIVPTYAEYWHSIDSIEPQSAVAGGQIAAVNHFDNLASDFQSAGAYLFPLGYYLWRSPTTPDIKNAILHGINLWNTVEKHSPKRKQVNVRTYLALYSDFQIALAAREWDIASTILAEIKRSHRATWDNQRYLEIQLLAEQQDWEAIWAQRNFTQLARMTVPYRVRGALLTAFHYMNLQQVEREGSLDDALAKYVAKRQIIVEQLTTHAGLTSLPVLRVFAYEAHFTQNHGQLEALRAEVTDEFTLQLIESLITRLLPTQAADVVDTNDTLRIAVQEALKIDDYDGALLHSEQLSNILDRVELNLEIASTSQSELLCQQALERFEALSQNEQLRLLSRESYTRRHLENVQQRLNPSSVQINNALVDWIDWFELAQIAPNAPVLRAALHTLKTINPAHFWTATHITELGHRLLTFVIDDSLMKQSYAIEAITSLRSIFLEDETFPRDSDEYIEIYEAFLIAIVLWKKTNAENIGFALRLAFAILQRDPSQVNSLLKLFQDLIAKPIPALEQQALDIFELLIEFGMEQEYLVDWYQRWISHLLNLPLPRTQDMLEGWQRLGIWLQASPDLLNSLTASLKAILPPDATLHPISKLPKHFKIGIFTMRPESAKAAASILNTYNQDLQIRICDERDMNGTAEAIASHSDMVVIVTTCITHALYYGIKPLIDSEKIVYPSSAGITSILRAITENAHNLR